MTLIRSMLTCFLFLPLIGCSCNAKRAEDAYRRGYDAKKRGDLDAAIAAYTEAIEHKPDYDDAYYSRGMAYSAKSQLDEAIKDFNEAIRLNDTNAGAYFHRGRVYSIKGDADAAIRDFTASLRLDPKQSIALLGRGMALMAKRDLDAAIADFNESIRIDPANVGTWLERANCFMGKGDYGQAVANLKEAARLEPTNARTVAKITWVYVICPKVEFRDSEKALEYAKKACEISGEKDYFCLESLAAAHALNGDFTDAAKWQKKAIELNAGRDDSDVPRQILAAYEMGKPFPENQGAKMLFH